MAKITIGGVEHHIAEMNFVAVELAWPFMEQALATVHPIAGTNASLSVIAAGLMETEGFDPEAWKLETHKVDDEGNLHARPQELIHIDLVNHLRRRLKANEIAAVKLCLFDMIDEAGIELTDPAQGEALAALAKEASPLMDAAINTSLSLSPQGSREEAGTA